jgi:hypothetical protein
MGGFKRLAAGGCDEGNDGGWGGWGVQLGGKPGAFSSGSLDVVINPLAVQALTDQLGASEKRVQELHQQLDIQGKKLLEKEAQVQRCFRY